MEDSKQEYVSKRIVDGVEITEYKDGHSTFVLVDSLEKKPEVKKEESNRSWLGKIVDWFRTSKVTPYVKIRDLADPFGDRTDPDAGSDGKNAAEIGIKIRF